jgi:flagellum-specific peptidoglycan hydrolase FlgJ
VTVSAGGVITGFNFIPGAAATMTSPTSVPLHLLALEQAAHPGVSGDLAVGGDSAGRVTSDAQLRAAIVNVAGYYLRLAKTKTPAQMEALIWGDTSSDDADHGPSCAAFASLTLELAAQTVGLQSWVSGGSTYPWPLPAWADVRVQTNPDSPAITSLQADAQAHGRWHPRGDGYEPQPGDWALYDGHVEVVTSYASGVLDTIGADSLPDLTVNAHSSAAPLAEQGVLGFIDNGNLRPAAGSLGASAPTASEQAPAQQAPMQQDTGPAKTPASPAATPAAGTANAKVPARAAAKPGAQRPAAATTPARASAAVPGLPGAGTLSGAGGIPGTDSAPAHGGARTEAAAAASVPGLPSVSASPTTMDAPGTAVIPGASATPAASPAQPAAHATPPANAKPAPAAKPSAPATSAPSSSTGSSSTGSSSTGSSSAGSSSTGSSGRQYSTPGTRDQQAFISLVAPGAVAAQQRYGVPAAVTIAQAIEESAWGQSGLAAQYHNLFGIKGTGPAGRVSLPTAEFEGGHWVTVDAAFRVYHNDAESIADHAELLATSGYYTRAMADRAVPDAFANALTGVYATDPKYGANLVALMKLYNLYQYDAGQAAAPAPTVSRAPAVSPTPARPATPAATASPSATAQHAATPEPSPTSSPASTPTSTQTAHPGSGSTSQDGAGQAGTSATSGAATASSGQIPGLVSPGPLTSGATAPAPVTPAAAPARIPGVRPASAAPAAARRAGSGRVNAVTAAYVTQARATPARATPEQAAIGHVTPGRATPQRASTGAAWYEPQVPQAVATALFASAKGPLARGEHLYRDVAACTNVSWKLLAAVDWMQCKADPRYSPVQGEKLGARNEDGTSYSTKSAALTQCACDLRELSAAVYGIDLTARRPLSVRELAAAFAAFRWGAILGRHGVSPMEFPYSVAGLTAQHQKMHWPSIDAPDAPDRPGARFREPFGAVPVVLSLGYPATV